MNLQKYLQENPKTHLIFDLDETILLLILNWNDWEKPIEEKITKIAPQALKNYQNRKIGLNELENLISQKGPEAKKLMVKNNEDFEKQLEGIKINQELVDFIKTNNYKFYIWSSNSKSTIEKVLKKLNIFEKFEKIITRNEVTFLKPQPEGFDLIWDHKTPKEQFLFVGDSQNDEDAAKAAGIDFYFIDFFK